MDANPLAPEWLTPPEDANALPPALWPRDAVRGADGEIRIAGVSAGDLVARFGTPLYVIDEEDATGRAHGVREAFERECARIGTRVSVYYAAKAFLSAEIARWMTEAGLGIDVCTGGELALARAAGVPADSLGVHGNNKSPAEIEQAVAAGAGSIVIDSLQEIERVADAASRAGRRQPVRLRVSTGVHAHTHDYLATAHEDQKFGIALADVEDVVAVIRSRPSLTFLGLHCHIGSQIFDSGGFEESAARLLEVHARLLENGPVPELNLGGGFGIAYRSGQEPTAIDTVAARIADGVQAACRRLSIPVPVLAFEPGRVILGPAGCTLYTVGTTKEVVVDVDEGADTAIRTYVSVDGGMSDNIRTPLYGAEYSARIAGRASSAPPVLVRVAGKHCESGDVVVDADYLPGDVAPGDVLAVPATGAYCWSLASNYNFVGRPPVVAVRDGEARIVVRGESQADVFARDVALEAPSLQERQA